MSILNPKHLSDPLVRICRQLAVIELSFEKRPIDGPDAHDAARDIAECLDELGWPPLCALKDHWTELRKPLSRNSQDNLQGIRRPVETLAELTWNLLSAMRQAMRHASEGLVVPEAQILAVENLLCRLSQIDAAIASTNSDEIPKKSGSMSLRLDS